MDKKDSQKYQDSKNSNNRKHDKDKNNENNDNININIHEHGMKFLKILRIHLVVGDMFSKTSKGSKLNTPQHSSKQKINIYMQYIRTTAVRLMVVQEKQ